MSRLTIIFSRAPWRGGVFVGWLASVTLALSLLLFLSATRADQLDAVNIAQLRDDDLRSEAAETFARVARVLPIGQEVSVNLPVWTESNSPFPEHMVTPWPVIQAVQDVPSLPIRFIASPNLPPHFIVWLWYEWPSSHYLMFNWERLGLSDRGLSSLMMWGVARNPPQPRSVCHWWTERKVGFPADVLLIDAAQSENDISCLAAGLLRHLGNPLWQYMAKEFIGQRNSEVLPRVRRLYECALRSEFDFVRANPPSAKTLKDKEDFLSKLDWRVRSDCLINI